MCYDWLQLVLNIYIVNPFSCKHFNVCGVRTRLSRELQVMLDLGVLPRNRTRYLHFFIVYTDWDGLVMRKPPASRHASCRFCVMRWCSMLALTEGSSFLAGALRVAKPDVSP